MPPLNDDQNDKHCFNSYYSIRIVIFSLHVNHYQYTAFSVAVYIFLDTQMKLYQMNNVKY